MTSAYPESGRAREERGSRTHGIATICMCAPLAVCLTRPYVTGVTWTPLESLVHVLKNAYSGELAAAYAYEGHRDSLSDQVQKDEIELIRLQELHHRQRVGEFLHLLGAEPCPRRERKFLRIGKSISLLCHIGGWFLPMYGAGKLEASNISEYEAAARHALAAGHPELVDDLLQMAEVEWDHEGYFRRKIAGHWMCRLFPLWPAPPPKNSIRASFADPPLSGWRAM